MPLNIAGIMAEVQANIGDGSELVGADGDAIAALAASELANCMNNAIAGSLTGNEMYAVGVASSGGYSKIGGGMYEVGVNIPAQFRPSLLPDIYGGVSDMAALFNNGYSAHPLTVIDVSGNIRSSRPYRSPAQFVQTGLAMFAGQGGGAYTVVSTQPSGRFV